MKLPRKTTKDQSSSIATKKKKPKNRLLPFKYLDEYRELFTMRMKPVSESFLQQIAGELLAWAYNNKDALILRDFFHDKGIPARSAARWAQKHQVLKQAMEEAKYMLGSRREKGAVKREYEPGMIRAVQHQYDPEWRKDEIWRAELKQKQDERSSQIKLEVIMPKFPDSKLVPKKEEEKHE